MLEDIDSCVAFFCEGTQFYILFCAMFFFISDTDAVPRVVKAAGEKRQFTRGHGPGAPIQLRHLGVIVQFEGNFLRQGNVVFTEQLAKQVVLIAFNVGLEQGDVVVPEHFHQAAQGLVFRAGSVFLRRASQADGVEGDAVLDSDGDLTVHGAIERKDLARRRLGNVLLECPVVVAANGIHDAWPARIVRDLVQAANELAAVPIAAHPLQTRTSLRKGGHHDVKP